MTTAIFGLRQRHVLELGNVFANKAGHFFVADQSFVNRCNENSLSASDIEFLQANGHVPVDNNLRSLSQKFQHEARSAKPDRLNYLILVPTLRCNLSCTYCQVSRVNEDRSGFDWTDEIRDQVLSFISTIDGPEIKVEFQGGEPTLRLDLIKSVIDACGRFESAEFIICTNLASLGAEFVALLSDKRVHISTSLDGNRLVHEKQRTSRSQYTEQFFENLRYVIDLIGAERVSALPTIDQSNPPDPQDLIDAYTTHGFNQLFLRPINYQGFARKRHPASKSDHNQWWEYYAEFIEALIQRNFANQAVILEETYLSLCLKRIFRIGVDGHVDLRNPNPVGIDYVVIDYDGALYPTDEARMLTRSGVVDLKIGAVGEGIDETLKQLFNANVSNDDDPQCAACVYQPFCGRDVIDDLSRYGRIDLPRHETFFCQKHLRLFDLCMRLIYSDDPAVQYSLAKWLGLAGASLPGQPRAL